MSNIKVNDLVMVVKPSVCCGSSMDIGEIFTVLEVKEMVWGQCGLCGKIWRDNAAAKLIEGRAWEGINISRLIKIDPLSEPESITKDEEVPA